MWVISEQNVNGIDELEDLYEKHSNILSKYSNLEDEADDYNWIGHPIFGSIFCVSTYKFMKYAEQSFEDEKSINLIRELFNTRDKDNIIIACNMLMKLKLKDNVGKL